MVKVRGWDGAAQFPMRHAPITIDDELRVAESIDRAWRVGYSFGRDAGLRRGFAIGLAVALVIGVVLWI